MILLSFNQNSTHGFISFQRDCCLACSQDVLWLVDVNVMNVNPHMLASRVRAFIALIDPNLNGKLVTIAKNQHFICGGQI